MEDRFGYNGIIWDGVSLSSAYLPSMFLEDIQHVAFLLVLRTYRIVRDVPGGARYVR